MDFNTEVRKSLMDLKNTKSLRNVNYMLPTAYLQSITSEDYCPFHQYGFLYDGDLQTLAEMLDKNSNAYTVFTSEMCDDLLHHMLRFLITIIGA